VGDSQLGPMKRGKGRKCREGGGSVGRKSEEDAWRVALAVTEKKKVNRGAQRSQASTSTESELEESHQQC